MAERLSLLPSPLRIHFVCTSCLCVFAPACYADFLEREGTLPIRSDVWSCSPRHDSQRRDTNAGERADTVNGSWSALLSAPLSMCAFCSVTLQRAVVVSRVSTADLCGANDTLQSGTHI